MSHLDRDITYSSAYKPASISISVDVMYKDYAFIFLEHGDTSIQMSPTEAEALINALKQAIVDYNVQIEALDSKEKE